MNVKAIWKKLSKVNQKEPAIRISMKEIKEVIDSAPVDDNFIKQYFEYERQLQINRNISIPLAMGIGSGYLFVCIDVFKCKFLLLLIFLLIGLTIIYFVLVFIYTRPVNCVLIPYATKLMASKIETTKRRLKVKPSKISFNARKGRVLIQSTKNKVAD